MWNFINQKRANGAFLKVEIVDNAERLRNGESVFTSAAIKPVSFASRSLKRRPESLK